MGVVIPAHRPPDVVEESWICTSVAAIKFEVKAASMLGAGRGANAMFR